MVDEDKGTSTLKVICVGGTLIAGAVLIYYRYWHGQGRKNPLTNHPRNPFTPILGPANPPSAAARVEASQASGQSSIAAIGSQHIGDVVINGNDLQPIYHDLKSLKDSLAQLTENIKADGLERRLLNEQIKKIDEDISLVTQDIRRLEGKVAEIKLIRQKMDELSNIIREIDGQIVELRTDIKSVNQNLGAIFNLASTTKEDVKKQGETLNNIQNLVIALLTIVTALGIDRGISLYNGSAKPN